MSTPTKTDDLLIRRSFKARVFHAILFELIAILLTTLFFVLILRKDAATMGILSVIVSLIATGWNGIYNYFFDKVQKKIGFSRTKNIRILHALGFEGGLTVVTLPIMALYLNVGIITAFWMEAALLLFFLPYSIWFNYIYDKIYLWFLQRNKH